MGTIAIFGVFALTGYAVYLLYQSEQGGSDMSKNAPVPDGTQPIITNIDGAQVDLNAKVWEFCYGVASAEGFGVDPNNVPTRFHNPGDLGPDDTGYPGEYHSGSTVSILPDDVTGWRLLYAKIYRAFTGQSHVFNVNMTIVQFAQKYAGDWQNWANNVANYLGVSTQTVIADWLKVS